MTTMATKKLNLPLPQEMHEAIFAESREMGVPTVAFHAQWHERFHFRWHSSYRFVLS